jgi:hypothetical protein
MLWLNERIALRSQRSATGATFSVGWASAGEEMAGKSSRGIGIFVSPVCGQEMGCENA